MDFLSEINIILYSCVFSLRRAWQYISLTSVMSFLQMQLTTLCMCCACMLLNKIFNHSLIHTCDLSAMLKVAVYQYTAILCNFVFGQNPI